MDIKAIKVSRSGRYKEIQDDILRVEGWIETHKGNFSILEVAEELDVSCDLCRSVAENHPLVSAPNEELKRKRGPQKRYHSNARLPEPTYEGLQEEERMTKEYLDELGRGAREDFWHLVETRRRYAKRKYKVIMRL